MKSNYCFIRNFGAMRPGSFVYRVRVGTSQREQTRLALVQEFCKDNCIYFHKWSEQVDSALCQAKAPWRRSGNALASPFIHASLSIFQLYDMIIDDSFDTYERNHKESKFAIWLNHHTDPDYIILQNNLQCITKCPTLKRQNLSSNRLSEGARARMCFCFILFLFALDAVVSQVLNLIFPAV